MSLPRIEGTATLMTLSQLKEMFFAVRINKIFEYRSKELLNKLNLNLAMKIISFSLVWSCSSNSPYSFTQS
jgi:hypothetical protein